MSWVGKCTLPTGGHSFCEVGPNQFGQRQITIGENANGKTQVLTGLKPDERVIADGSLFLQFQNSFQH